MLIYDPVNTIKLLNYNSNKASNLAMSLSPEWIKMLLISILISNRNSLICFLGALSEVIPSQIVPLFGTLEVFVVCFTSALYRHYKFGIRERNGIFFFLWSGKKGIYERESRNGEPTQINVRKDYIWKLRIWTLILRKLFLLMYPQE